MSTERSIKMDEKETRGNGRKQIKVKV